MDQIMNILTNINFQSRFWMFVLPVAIIAIDVCTGVLNAWLKGSIKSYRLREGLVKKVGEILLLVISILANEALGLKITSIVSIYITFMEFVSIMENLSKLGVPIPKFVAKALAETSDAIQNGELPHKSTDEDE